MNKKIKEILTRIKRGAIITLRFLKKNWEVLLTILLSIIVFYFLFSQKSRLGLTLGGILMIWVGFRNYFFTGLKKRNYMSLTGLLMILMGFIALLVAWVLPLNLEYFVLLFIIIYCLGIVAVYFAYKFQLIKNLGKILTLLFLIFIATVNITTLYNLMSYIYKTGFVNWIDYSGSIIFLLLTVGIIFIIIEIINELIFTKLLRLKDKPLDNYYNLTLSISIFILIMGFAYIKLNENISELDSFLIVLSVAFFSSLVGVGALKSILSRQNSAS